jgi:hypothetical protein
MIKYLLADKKNISGILELQSKNLVTNLKDNEKDDGFVTTPFSIEQLEDLIKLDGVFIALKDENVVSYVMCASWQYWTKWPMFEYMASFLETLEYKGVKLTMQNSYQYGPICVSKDCRGTKVFENIFEFARENMNKKYPILVTFINKINQRSYEAHVRKLGLEVITEFEFNNNHFYELVYDTSKKVEIK